MIINVKRLSVIIKFIYAMYISYIIIIPFVQSTFSTNLAKLFVNLVWHAVNKNLNQQLPVLPTTRKNLVNLKSKLLISI